MRTVTIHDPLSSRVLIVRDGRPMGGSLVAAREPVGESLEVTVHLDPLEPHGPIEILTLPASEVWIDSAWLERWADSETRYRLAEELRRRAEDERERCTCGHARRAHHAGGVDDGGCTACECTAYADQIGRLTRERDEARAEVEDLRGRTVRQLVIEVEAREDARTEAARLRDRLQTVVDEQVSPHETLPSEELITLLEHSLAEGRHERERLRGALERAERALQGIATAQRFDRDVFSDDSAYVDWARSLSLHVAEIARAALAGEGR